MKYVPPRVAARRDRDTQREQGPRVATATDLENGKGRKVTQRVVTDRAREAQRKKS